MAALIALAVAIVLIGSLLKSPWFKGRFGEAMVNLLLQLLLDKRCYHLLKNVTLPTADGLTTQIDHIIVSRYGVFVIETKNMRGWIFGGAYDETWTQKFRHRSFQMQNPLRQNYKHIKVLQELLQLPESVFRNVVILGPDCEFKKEKPEGVLTGGYARYIKSFCEEVLTEGQVGWTLTRIQGARLAPGITTHVEHVKNVRQIVREKESRGGRSEAV